LARDNYKFAKRGREIAKKKKKEEKLQRKLTKNSQDGSEVPEAAHDDDRQEAAPES
jgi:hypothetical protein